MVAGMYLCTNIKPQDTHYGYQSRGDTGDFLRGHVTSTFFRGVLRCESGGRLRHCRSGEFTLSLLGITPNISAIYRMHKPTHS